MARLPEKQTQALAQMPFSKSSPQPPWITPTPPLPPSCCTSRAVLRYFHGRLLVQSGSSGAWNTALPVPPPPFSFPPSLLPLRTPYRVGISVPPHGTPEPLCHGGGVLPFFWSSPASAYKAGLHAFLSGCRSLLYDPSTPSQGAVDMASRRLLRSHGLVYLGPVIFGVVTLVSRPLSSVGGNRRPCVLALSHQVSPSVYTPTSMARSHFLKAAPDFRILKIPSRSLPIDPRPGWYTDGKGGRRRAVSLSLSLAWPRRRRQSAELEPPPDFKSPGSLLPHWLITLQTAWPQSVLTEIFHCRGVHDT
ncbi:hypothetical protein EDB80DRAFT_456611 [Ilyonectria destructans]|nr:hypothetical protein EDB80DRAFT_456611 [Ilyonectria destructans]